MNKQPTISTHIELQTLLTVRDNQMYDTTVWA